MAKSMRSKWKKAQKAIKAENHKPIVARRLEKLHGKLLLCAHGGISKVPVQDPLHVFSHTAPTDDVADQRLSLPKMRTNVHKGLRGHESAPARPHLLAPFVDPDAEADKAACAAAKAAARDEQTEFTEYVDVRDEEAVAAAAAAAAKDAEGDDDEVAVENDDEPVVAAVAAPRRLVTAKDSASGAKKMKGDLPSTRLVSGGKKVKAPSKSKTVIA